VPIERSNGGPERKREEIEREICKKNPACRKKRSEQTPVFAFAQQPVRSTAQSDAELPGSFQPPTKSPIGSKHVDHDQYEHAGALQADSPSRSGHIVIWRTELNARECVALDFKLRNNRIAREVGVGMQNLDSRTKFSRRFIVSSRSELRYFSQCDCRQKQQEGTMPRRQHTRLTSGQRNHATAVTASTTSAASASRDKARWAHHEPGRAAAKRSQEKKM